MVGVSRLLVALALAGLFTQQAYADVIPTRRAADTTDSSKKVESRLLQLGVAPEAAKTQVQNLTELEFLLPAPKQFGRLLRHPSFKFVAGVVFSHDLLWSRP